MARASALWATVLAAAGALLVLASLEPRVGPMSVVAQGAGSSNSMYTVTFQDGVSPPGYAGTADTHLDFYNPAKYEGGRIDFGVTFDDKKRSLIRFDVSQHIAPGAHVLTATLTLRVNTRSASLAMGVRCYQVLQPWAENTATWNEADSGVAWWGGAGCEGNSRSQSPVCQREVNQATGGVVDFNLTSVVQDWIDNPGANHGLLLQGYQTAGRVNYQFSSSEASVTSYRPRLSVIYEGQPPQATPTPTLTATPTATPPNPVTLYSTLSDWKFDQCLKTGKDPGIPPTVRTSRVETMLIMWTGTVYSARLHIVICQTNPGAEHPIYLNGHLVGRAPPQGTTGCECNQLPISPEHQFVFELDHGFVLQGANYITVTNAADPYEEWKASRAQIELVGAITGATRSEFELGIDWEQRPLKAAMQAPIDYDPNTPAPLLISVPGTGEDRIDGLNRFAIEANERGWLLASLDMRHIRWSEIYEQVARSPSLAVQQDVLGVLSYLQAHHNVDPARVYVAGFSTGGGIAATMAAKYPDVFAGVLDYSGPTDYAQWYAERLDLLSKLEFEFNGGPHGNFEYPRRSSRWLARNLQYVPMRIRHSAVGDTDVPFAQSENLIQAMSGYYDLALNHKELITHTLGHVDPDAAAKSSDLGFLAQFVRAQNPRELHIVTDEGKSFFWVTVEKEETAAKSWRGGAEVDARYDPLTNTIWLSAGDADFAEGKPLTVTLDLSSMGLNTVSSYDVEEYDPHTGEFALHSLAPEAGRLRLLVARNSDGLVRREFVLYPSTGAQLGYALLRQGADGYAGSSDTCIVSDQFPSEGPETSHALETTLRLGCDWRRKALLRFDLGVIPDGVIVKGARLTLSLLEARSTGIDVSLYKVLRPWKASAATWTFADQGLPWVSAGAEGVGTDRAAAPTHTFRGVGSLGSYSFNAKSLVEDWLSTPEGNRGLLLIGNGSCSSSTKYPVGSAECGEETGRPRLEVWYMEPVATPWPTPTPTGTLSASALQGRVTLQGRPTAPHNSWSVALTVTVGSTEYSESTDEWGSFTVSGLTAGAYDVRVKSRHTLSVLQQGVTLSTGETKSVEFGILPEGDANDDNHVNISDFSILSGGFYPNYDGRCDFNDDGAVNIADFSLLAANFNRHGE